MRIKRYKNVSLISVTKFISIFSIVCALLLSSTVYAEEIIKPVPINGFSDNATFTLYSKDSAVGTIEYTLDAAGNYQRKFTIKMAGQTSENEIKITSDNEGLWQSMTMKTAENLVEINRVSNKAELSVKDKKYSVNLTPNHFLYDNFGPVFETLMFKAYDMTKKGKQKLSCYLIPNMMTDVEIEYKGNETAQVAGKDINLNRFDFTIMGILCHFKTDPDYRILYMGVPSQYAAFVRQGYEDIYLADQREQNIDPLLSKPEFSTRKEIVKIPMRDSIKLATDMYFPDVKDTKFPTILIRTPYKKEMMETVGIYYAKRGYAVAIQDCRGRFASEGNWEPFVNEPKDGYDTIEYLGTQPWSNGKVGMIGGSYVGWVQLWAASLKPPHLTTIIPNVAPPDPFYNIPYEYGTFFIFGSIWWAEILETNATGDLSGKSMSKIGERKYEEILKQLPVIDLDKKIFGKKNTYWRLWIEHNTNDSYWQPANFLDKLKDFDIPVFLQSGWFDGDGIGSKLNYTELKKSKNKYQKLIIGPWGHTDTSQASFGEYNFGLQAAPDLQIQYLRWFDYWLKGIDNKIVEEPLVQIFSMFSNQWHKGNTYPLPETQFTKYYIDCTLGANTSRGDGILSTQSPVSKKEFDTYTYDPGNPTPHPQWNYKNEEDPKAKKSKTIELDEDKKSREALHNKITDSRPDILVYRTEPLTEPLTIAGPISAKLYAASSAPDTDWFVTLMDEDENGKIFPLVHGTLRARFRNSFTKPQLLTKDQVYDYDIDMWQTGMTFPKGHRIRIEIASALFPMFSRNLNTGGHNEKETKYEKAHQKIYHNAQYPSHILLPVIPQTK